MLNEPLLAFLKAILVLYSYTKDKYVLLKSLLAVNTLTLRLMIKVSDDVTEKEKKKNNKKKKQTQQSWLKHMHLSFRWFRYSTQQRTIDVQSFGV